ncbi:MULTISPECIES: ATP-binding protein [unclassified Leeuwenhoekiella]|uniref:ATP-binding protein n=1 Tax=unclassified Leeuwenhoekiella TaxID=2615029 RepID=UPI000C639A57|nr:MULTISPECIES: ATP-binding protein [unclassified Leeuwenhoekiella]MAW95880.1 AAA family ATPase [Leeuwenhoekiella sp.]MBA82849.1 AAA family ATPase [Leeuwenhoekiella sp.]|tara:strand:+ start:3784 stop:4920 length:1137 start_codon:yes stop_codon:yes gene_type:complete
MINKRLLIKNLLAHNDENSFYDKKRKVDISNKEGKAKFLKHICALSNSNPKNNSYIVIGVEDESNEIVGVPFFDDSKIQNLINAYLDNPPIVSYENIPFPHLPADIVVGLVTIRPLNKLTALKKNIWKYWGGTVFYRDGSISMTKSFKSEILDVNSELVATIEKHSHNSIEHTLDGVIDFINVRHADLHTQYKVFKEQFVVCWAGNRKEVKGETYFSRVDIELINEQVRIFYSALDEVSISMTEDSFTILEYVLLGLQGNNKYYPLEELTLYFNENGSYHIDSDLVFEPPQYDKKVLHHIYNNNNAILQKVLSGDTLNKGETEDLYNLPATYLICYLNGFESALEKLESIRPFLRKFDSKLYQSYKENIRILRKVKYN